MKIKVAILIAALLGAMSLVASPAAADSSKYEPPQKWIAGAPLKALESGRCVAPESGSLTNGTELVEVDCSRAGSWLVGRPIESATGRPGGGIQLRYSGTNLCLGIKPGAYDYGHLWQCSNWKGVNTSQVWYTRYSSVGGFRLGNEKYDECLSSYKDWTGVVPQYTLTSCNPFAKRQAFDFVT